MGAEALLGLVSAHLAWCEWSMNSLASGKCLQNLENVYFQAFFFLPRSTHCCLKVTRVFVEFLAVIKCIRLALAG